MGLVFKMMLPLIMIALIYGYMMGGHKVLDFMSNLSTQSKGVEGVGNAVTNEDVTIYQWTDEKGVKHYSNTQPAGESVNELVLPANANVIQAVKAPPEKEQKEARGGQVTSLLKSPYSPGGGKEMIDQTTDLKNTLNQRMQEQQNILEQISGHKK